MHWPSELPILDSHHHLWDMHSGIRYPLLHDSTPHKFFLGNYARLRTNYLPSDYLAASKGLPIVGSVIIEAECAQEARPDEMKWMASANKDYPNLANVVVAAASFESPEIEAALDDIAAFPSVRAIRCKPATAPTPIDIRPSGSGSLQDPNWRRGFALLHRHGLAWDLRVPAWHLEEAAELIADGPRTDVVVEHAGLPLDRSTSGLRRWRRGMQSLAGSQEVWVKLSCLLSTDHAWDERANSRIVHEVIEMFGDHRCMFGSNYPVDQLQIPFLDLYQAYRRMTEALGLEAQRRLFCSNALSFYRSAGEPSWPHSWK